MIDQENVIRIQKRSDSKLAGIILPFCRYRKLEKYLLKVIRRLEGGEFWSKSLRIHLKSIHNVQVGQYSYGPCLKPGQMPRGTIIGNYCSIAAGVTIFRRNHPVNRISQNALFYNPTLKIVSEGTIEKDEDNPLSVGHDVWIGHGTTITPSCKVIGNGAIIAAGSVVTKNIPPYSIVAGIPAKILRERFPPELQVILEESRWWYREISDLPDIINLFLKPADLMGEQIKKAFDL